MSVPWRNWSGRIEAHPEAILRVSSEDEAAAAVRRAADERRPVRVVGAAHSHAPLVPTAGLLLDPAALSGVVAVDRDAGEARVLAGTRIADLGVPLREAGVALHNQGDIDRQAIAGATATGTHGTGRTLQNLSASVLGARIILADGEIVDCDATHAPDLYRAAQLSLGALGVVTQLHLAVRDAYRLEERMWLQEIDDVLDAIDVWVHETRHFEFFWLPGSRRAACKSLRETDASPRYPLGAEGSRLAWSHEVLANDRPDKHTEMEYSVPAAHGVECFREIRTCVERHRPDVGWPIEYRTVAADDVWCSPAYQRETVTISVHQGIERDDEPLFRACEAVFDAFGGRPHWGKVHYQTAESLARLHPRWGDWWAVRDRVDPEERFLNPHLASLRPGREHP